MCFFCFLRCLQVAKAHMDLDQWDEALSAFKKARLVSESLTSHTRAELPVKHTRAGQALCKLHGIKTGTKPWRSLGGVC